MVREEISMGLTEKQISDLEKAVRLVRGVKEDTVLYYDKMEEVQDILIRILEIEYSID